MKKYVDIRKLCIVFYIQLNHFSFFSFLRTHTLLYTFLFNEKEKSGRAFFFFFMSWHSHDDKRHS